VFLFHDDFEFNWFIIKGLLLFLYCCRFKNQKGISFFFRFQGIAKHPHSLKKAHALNKTEHLLVTTMSNFQKLAILETRSNGKHYA